MSITVQKRSERNGKQKKPRSGKVGGICGNCGMTLENENRTKELIRRPSNSDNWGGKTTGEKKTDPAQAGNMTPLRRLNTRTQKNTRGGAALSVKKKKGNLPRGLQRGSCTKPGGTKTLCSSKMIRRREKGSQSKTKFPGSI